MNDNQMVSVICSATDENGKIVDREVNVTLCAISSEEIGEGIIETGYQMSLFDAVEGGIEISSEMREIDTAAASENILIATLAVNWGGVSSFEELNILEQKESKLHIIDNEQMFIVDFPRY